MEEKLLEQIRAALATAEKALKEGSSLRKVYRALRDCEKAMRGRVRKIERAKADRAERAKADKAAAEQAKEAKAPPAGGQTPPEE